MKTCPFCAEEIYDEAIVCKHCGHELDPSAVSQLIQPVQQSILSSKSISDFFKRLFNFSGSANRTEFAVIYFGQIAVVFLIAFAAYFFEALLAMPEDSLGGTCYGS